MKKLFLIITLCFQVSYANDLFEDLVNNFYQIDDNTNTVGLEKKIIDAKKTAISWLEKYISENSFQIESNPKEKRILYSMLNGLKQSFLFLPNNMYRPSPILCDSENHRMGAMQIESENLLLIHICFVQQKDLDLPQIFIHESFHLAEYILKNESGGKDFNYDHIQSEALATKYELLITEYINGCVFIHNGYTDRGSKYNTAVMSELNRMLPKLCE